MSTDQTLYEHRYVFHVNGGAIKGKGKGGRTAITRAQLTESNAMREANRNLQPTMSCGAGSWRENAAERGVDDTAQTVVHHFHWDLVK